VRASTLARLSVAGARTDLVRIALTAVASAAAVLALLSAATVASLGFAGSQLGSLGNDTRYRSALLAEPGLRPGVVTVFVLLTVPVLAFAGQCARLGAPARDRRLAAIRLAGATPRQAIAVAAGEAIAAATVGAALGLAIYFGVRPMLDHPDANGQLGLPVDVIPPIWSIAVIGVALPLLAGLATLLMMRKVIVTPLGVVRRARRKGAPKPWPGALVVLALLIFGAFNPAMQYSADHHWHAPHWLEGGRWPMYMLLYGGAAAAMLGVCFSSGWIAYTSGRVLRRCGRGASSQIAGARLTDDPWSGSRSMAVILIATVFGGGVAGYWVALRTQQQAGSVSDDSFYANTFRLIAIAIAVAMLIAALGMLVTITEAIVSRRRAYASLVATGVPRAALAWSSIWQNLAAATPTVVFGVVVGAGAARLFTGATVDTYTDGDSARLVTRVPWPWPQMGLTIAVALGVVLLATLIGLLFIKPSTSVEELRTP
jgi:hypothetical protein